MSGMADVCMHIGHGTGKKIDYKRSSDWCRCTYESVFVVQGWKPQGD